MLNLLPETKDRLRVVEGIHGTFYYHLWTADGGNFGLCGDRVMHTSIPVSAWGTVTHIKERWCSRCEGAATQIEHDDLLYGLRNRRERPAHG